jgi:hypothetical protein
MACGLSELNGKTVSNCSFDFLLSGTPLWLNVLTRGSFSAFFLIISIPFIKIGIKSIIKKEWKNSFLYLFFGLALIVASINTAIGIYRILNV